MKTQLSLLISLAAFTCAAQTTGVPWTPVNLTGKAISISIVDSLGVVQGSLVSSGGRNETLWVPIPTGGGLMLGDQILSLDSSGTNANYTVFYSATNGTVMALISNAPAVSSDSWPEANWQWFWAGFGMFASFFGFTWALRFTKQIGRANPEP